MQAGDNQGDATTHRALLACVHTTNARSCGWLMLCAHEMTRASQGGLCANVVLTSIVPAMTLLAACPWIMKVLRRIIFAAVTVLLATQPRLLWACSTCMVGDPTQTLMGTEKPYEDRLRLGLDMITRDESIGLAGFNQKQIDETRLSLNLAYAPNRRMMLALNVPLVKRELHSFNLASQAVDTLGDITLTYKNFLQDRASFQKHMYGLIAGLRLPTASEQMANGVPLDFDVQPGTGAVTVNAGGWYAHFRFPFMLYCSAAYHVSGDGDQQFQAGDALTLNAILQYAFSVQLSAALGLEGRWSEQDSFAGSIDVDSGGTQVYLAPGAIYTIAQDLLFNIAVKFPVIENLLGEHEEGTIVTFGVTYDFDLHK